VNLLYQPLGDTGVRISFGNKISKETNQSIRLFTNYIKEHPINGIIEWIPTYTALSIFYNPSIILYKELVKELEKIKDNMKENELTPAFVIEIPTLYGGDMGPDLGYVAKYNGLDEDEVIAIHTSMDYLIYMMGFVPGFPYLGGMDKTIATPRQQRPRAKIDAGSVGIAGEQTGIYPLETPGGWQIIGRTPVKLYDPNRIDPILLSAGNYLRFIPINIEEFKEIEKAMEEGHYHINRFKVEGDM